MTERNEEWAAEAVAELVILSRGRDIESVHQAADDVLCALLRQLGYDDVCDQWLKVDKWYA